MTEEQKAMLKTVEIDVEDAMDRFLGNEELYLKFLGKFVNDENFEKMKIYLDEDKEKEAFKCAHTIKGVAGNLSINGLYKVIVPYVEYLRGGDIASAKEHLPELEKIFYESIDVIRKLQ